MFLYELTTQLVRPQINFPFDNDHEKRNSHNMTKGWLWKPLLSPRFLILFVTWELSKTVISKSRHLERYPKPCRSNPNPDESKSTNITFSWIWNKIRIPVVWSQIWIRIWMAVEGTTWRQFFLSQVVTDKGHSAYAQVGSVTWIWIQNQVGIKFTNHWSESKSEI